MQLDASTLTAPTFALTCALTLALIPVARHLGLVDNPCQRKRHQLATPLIGGLAMFIAVTASLLLAAPPIDSVDAFLTGSLLLVAVGLRDDIKPIDYRIRFALQAVAAGILAIWGNVRIDSLGNLFGLGDIALGPFAIPFTIFAVVGLINAVNMLDGLDGLAGSVMVAILAPIGIYAALNGLDGIVQIIIILLAAVLAFLVFNYRFPWRASAHTFMGDTGSNFLGYALAWIVIMLAGQPNAGLTPIAILWLIAFPVSDTLLTMWRRYRKGQSPFQPGHDHVHFILERAGFSINITVLIIAGVSFLCAGFGLLAGIQGWPEPLLTLLLFAFAALLNLTLTRATRVTKALKPLAPERQRQTPPPPLPPPAQGQGASAETGAHVD
jgi:UDP-GlcNAc:undecaprenyl-phosphate GlcNAc-1-phosphate transferase